MLHVFAVLAAALLFGTTGTSMALGPDDTTPLSVGAVRLVIGGTGLAVIAFVLARRHARQAAVGPAPRLGIRPLALMVLTGFCLALYQPLFFLGTERNGVAVGTVVALGSAPILAGLLEWVLTRRVPTTTWMLATALATVGVVLLGFGGEAPTAGGGGGTDPIGLLASVGAGATFAVIANTQRRLLDEGWDPFTVVGAMGASSAVISAFVLPFVDLSWLATTAGLVMALWLGLATISIAYVLFTWGLGGLTAATAATLTLGEPLTASILGIVVLGERLSVLAIVGLVVLAARARAARVGVARSARPGAVRGGGVTMPHIEIRVDDLTGEATRALIAFHLDGMHDTSPPESVHALDIDGLRHPSITFWSAWIDGELAGIGALKAIDAERGELKSMRVDDRFRGSGVGRALLRHIIAEARERGMTSLWLETGSPDDFVPAQRLYESEGFTRCGPFEGYTDDPFSVFMTRTL